MKNNKPLHLQRLILISCAVTGIVCVFLPWGLDAWGNTLTGIKNPVGWTILICLLSVVLSALSGNKKNPLSNGFNLLATAASTLALLFSILIISTAFFGQAHVTNRDTTPEMAVFIMAMSSMAALLTLLLTKKLIANTGH